MASFDDLLAEITDDSVQAAKLQLQDLLQQAKVDSSAFARKNAEALEEWIVELRNGELDQEEFDELIAAQRAAAEQFVNTQAIAGRARARELTLTALDIAVKKVVPVVIAMI
jgi:hypothetical protein